jgi:hypothetical protein
MLHPDLVIIQIFDVYAEHVVSPNGSAPQRLSSAQLASDGHDADHDCSP